MISKLKKKSLFLIQLILLITLILSGKTFSRSPSPIVLPADLSMGSFLHYQIYDLDCNLEIDGESREYSDIICDIKINFTQIESIYLVDFIIEFSNSKGSEPFLIRENVYHYYQSSNTLLYQNGTEIGNFIFFVKSIETISLGQKITLYHYLDEEVSGECSNLDNILKIDLKIYHLKSFRYEPSNWTSSHLHYEKSVGVLIIGGNILELSFFKNEFGIKETFGLYNLNLIQTDFPIPYEIDEENPESDNNDYIPIIILGVVISGVVLLYIMISKRRR